MAATNNMHNLTTLIKRLEAATSRLEDIATSTELPKDVSAPEQTVASTAGASLDTPPPSQAAHPKTISKPAEEPVAEAIEEFDQLISSSVGNYVKLSKELGGVIAKQAAEVLKGFQEQRNFLLITTKAVKPDAPVYQSLLKPINDALMAVTELKDSNRPHPMYTQLSAVADGIMMLAWITLDSRPHKHVEESLSSAQFFGNRVLKEQKDKNPKQVEWVQAFYQVFRDLAEYIKQNFSSGITWNTRGEPAQDAMKFLSEQISQHDPSIVGATPVPPPPPPPPPGPPPVLDIKSEATSTTSLKGLDAVFSDLNKGADVTRGLRKVDKSEMTHKNPSLRAGNIVGDQNGSSRGKSPAPGKKPKPESMRVKKPAKKELDGNKWTIENYDKELKPIEIETSLSQSVLISRCNNTTVILRGKANQVTIENSTRLSLVVDTLISTVDVVKAQNFALQVIGTLPTVMLDQVDGGQIYFSKETTGTKVFTSKSSGINLNVLSGPDDDYKEVPLPSQICSYYDEEKGDLVNEIVAHAG
ncbi:suppressor of rasval19 [Conoideocrella luteorostrata]|uniref:Adenylyl cyclase-associated protein n=1 Tax=Conoideocrella luteorostrata TaxID=1105319 RepID=A0AAJ0CYL1_9HYPO|nr:suppressor of rasval19 [Conoideocrella luteorostrata]